MESVRDPVQVVGGGFCGLAVAFYLVRAGRRVRLVESGERHGGLLRTLASASGLVETGANAILASQVVEECAQDIGLELVPALPSARKRYIWRWGAPRRWPLGVRATLRFLFFTLPRFLLTRAALAPRPGESVGAWGRRCLGAEATEYLLVPGLAGVYAGDAEKLSATLILGRFFSSTREKSAKGKLRGSVAPRAGMGSWAEAFVGYLRRHEVEFASEARDDLETVVALPAPAARAFLSEKAPILADLLAEIRTLPLVTATLFPAADTKGVEGFGCLFPRSQGFRVLGLLANDRIFPGRVAPGFRSETWIFGGGTDLGGVELNDEELYRLIRREREKMFGPAPLPAPIVHRWPRAIPAYEVGLEPILSGLGARQYRDGAYRIFGTYLRALGLGRVLAAAKELAEEYR